MELIIFDDQANSSLLVIGYVAFFLQRSSHSSLNWNEKNQILVATLKHLKCQHETIRIFKNLNTSLNKINFHLFFDGRDIAEMTGDFVMALPTGRKQRNVNFLLFVGGLGT